MLRYLSLVMSASVGYFVFGETVTMRFALGAALIVLAAIWGTRRGPREARVPQSE